jgi:hypothetical protein
MTSYQASILRYASSIVGSRSSTLSTDSSSTIAKYALPKVRLGLSLEDDPLQQTVLSRTHAAYAGERLQAFEPDPPPTLLAKGKVELDCCRRAGCNLRGGKPLGAGDIHAGTAAFFFRRHFLGTNCPK